MQERVCQTAIGGLLHDIGKVVYRSGDNRSHPESGCAFLQEAGVVDSTILQQVRFHHAKDLRTAPLPQDSLAYITYIADNIASAADRREAAEAGHGFSRELAQDSIFNRLNGNAGTSKYAPRLLSEKINFPTDAPIPYDGHFYAQCLRSCKEDLRGIHLDERYINSLLEILEACLTYVPSSTSLEEVADISLFDHCKLTAALGCCILHYLTEQHISDYRTALWRHEKQFYEQKAFLLYSMDLSGIQDFIYTITSDGALKALRARSFYLELLMEHLVDTLLEAAGLSRANCLYTGGGHTYLLLANTGSTRERIEQFETETNRWLLQHFGTGLYLAGGYAACSANDLKNESDGSYRGIFRQISAELSSRKLHRYSAPQLITLNKAAQKDGVRECAVCHRTDLLTEGEKCTLCAGLEAFSKDIQNKSFFAVSKTPSGPGALPLPHGCCLSAETNDSLLHRIKHDTGYRRSYAKNEFYTGQQVASKLWVGDYQNGDSFQALAQGAEGICRLAVLRADVDDLGRAFVSGFESEQYGQRYVTLSRTAAFSRSLSLFFKRHINQLLQQGTYLLTDKDDTARRATIVYAGGDDVFVIGAWDDIIGFAVDLHDELSAFTQGTLTISAGIGLYPEKYPVSSMARQTGLLEELSKSCPGKNAVTLFDEGHTYPWPEFINSVLEEKYDLIRRFFASSEDRGKAFLYKLLELMRSRGEKINLARYAYLLARMQPGEKAPPEQQVLYREFSRKMYTWMLDSEQCRQAITAIYIYVYTVREGDGTNEDRPEELR